MELCASTAEINILATPAAIISVFAPDGSPAGQIPNAKSNGTIIRYAVDIDLSPEGFLVVADRGANAIDVFAPDGSLVSKTPVVAPTSVVSLADGQFAVTSLASKRLVQAIGVDLLRVCARRCRARWTELNSRQSFLSSHEAIFPHTRSHRRLWKSGRLNS